MTIRVYFKKQFDAGLLQGLISDEQKIDFPYEEHYWVLKDFRTGKSGNAIFGCRSPWTLIDVEFEVIR